MIRTTVVMLAFATLGSVTEADAQYRGNRQNRQTRQEVARSQGVPPGQLPPPGQCRVWYENRPNGRQPAATSCRNAESIAARERNARVIYGEDVYYASRNNRDMRYPDDWERNTGNRGVYRVPGRNRDPRAGNDPYYEPYNNRSRYTTPAFQNGYRDGLEKGRDDGDDNDRFDAARHSWYRSATRGYEDEYGSKSEYQARYREGFQAGYDEGYRTANRR